MLGCRRGPPQPAARSGRVRYSNAYVWLVFVSALDAICTWMVLWVGGVEVNPIAGAVLATHGFLGLPLFKFGLVALVIALCEVIAETRADTGLRIVIFGIAVSTVPVVIGLFEMVG